MKRSRQKWVVRWSVYVLLLFFLILMLGIILPYTSFKTDVGFLRIKQHLLHHNHWKIAFFIHALGAVLSLPAGFTQFSESIRIKRRMIHRRLGYVYTITVLLVGAPTGLILAFYANGRTPSQIGFTLLSILWFYFTWLAFNSARKKDFTRHKAYMIRSYALTLSAITLRLWKFVIANTLAPDPLILYQVVTWLGFVPNMLVAEWLIWLSRHNKNKQNSNVLFGIRKQKEEGKNRRG